MYKILFIKNKIGKLKIDKYFTPWFESKTPLKYEVEYLDTDITTTSKKMSNETWANKDNVVCGDDLYDKLKAIIPEHKYHLVVFAHDLPLNGIRVNYTPYLPLYKHTDLIQLIDFKDGGKKLNHEIFHSKIHKAQRQGATFDDPMDKVVFNGKVEHYFKDNLPDAIPSNRSIALELLKDWWDKILVLDDEVGIKSSTIDLIKQFEGLSLKPYKDVAGVWTIGYGSTYMLDGKPVTKDTKVLTKKEAEELLAKKLIPYAQAVKESINIKLTQNQFDACCSLCYNVGINGFRSSTVVKRCNLNQIDLAAKAFLLWNKVKGVVVQGLVNRRTKEMELFLK